MVFVSLWLAKEPCILSKEPYTSLALSEEHWTITGWRRPIGCLKLQVIYRKKATNYRALLRKMTWKDMASYGSSPPCTFERRIAIKSFRMRSFKWFSRLNDWQKSPLFFQTSPTHHQLPYTRECHPEVTHINERVWMSQVTHGMSHVTHTHTHAGRGGQHRLLPRHWPAWPQVPRRLQRRSDGIFFLFSLFGCPCIFLGIDWTQVEDTLSRMSSLALALSLSLWRARARSSTHTKHKNRHNWCDELLFNPDLFIYFMD